MAQRSFAARAHRGGEPTYDQEGATTTVEPPGQPAHNMSYGPVELLAAYQPPTVGSPAPTNYSYDLDRNLEQTQQPGRSINYSYDLEGRLTNTSHPHGIINRSYSPTTGKLQSLSGPDGVTLNYQYDGQLMTAVTYTGTVTGTIQWTFDNAFRLISETVNNAVTQTFSYDNDDLLIQAGALTLTRDPESGRVVQAQAGTVLEDWTYSQYGEVASYQAGSLLAFSYQRDNLGRITQKTETSGASSTDYQYQYDLNGRLVTVLQDSNVIEQYTYDQNGNRLTTLNSDGLAQATYDDQDRLITHGDTVYTFTSNGELAVKVDTATGDTTEYDYDALGNLKEVVLPNWDLVEYRVDGANRRVAKLKNGLPTRQWLWRSMLQPSAEFDGSGALRARFVYAGQSNVPSLMVTPSGTYRLITDHLGSVRKVVDLATGVVAQELFYDAWGSVLLDTNPGFQPFGFAGGLYDADTELVRFGARDYDAETGRWTAKDPIRFDGGVNLFGYAAQDPINGFDPTGRWVWFLPAFPLVGPGLVAAATYTAAAVAGLAAGGATATAVSNSDTRSPSDLKDDLDNPGWCTPANPTVYRTPRPRWESCKSEPDLVSCIRCCKGYSHEDRNECSIWCNLNW